VTLPLTPLLVTGRLERVREALVDAALDVLVVTDMHDIRWLTGFTGSTGTLIVRREDAELLTDGRYRDQARDEIAASEGSALVVEARSGVAVGDSMLRLIGEGSRVGINFDRMTARLHQQLRDAHVSIHDASDLLAEARRPKGLAELERIERACGAADAALSEVAPLLAAVSTMQLTECDVRDELEYRMRLHGADGPSYDTIVAAGENAAFPHHRPTRRRIVEGDCVVIDVGALVDGYHSDMTRTFLVGNVDAELRRMYDVVCRVQGEALRAVREGVTGESMDAGCRDAFGADAALFVHGAGHGVGLNIHEAPWLRAGWQTPLIAGEVVTVEPGLYRVGLGGVRIEDLVVVEPTGCRILTLSPKDPQCPQLAPTT